MSIVQGAQQDPGFAVGSQQGTVGPYMVPLLDSQADRHQRAEGVEDAVENLYQLDLTVGEDGSQHKLIHDLEIECTVSGTHPGERW
jgi:hypothetical protein